MTGVKVTVLGVSKLQETLKNLNANINKGVNQGLSAIGLIVQNHAKQALQKPPKTGKLRKKRRNKNVVHQASAPGEAPATDTGALVDSIQMDVSENSQSVTISALTNYAAALEFKMNRPFLRPAVEQNKERFPGILAAYIEKNT